MNKNILNIFGIIGGILGLIICSIIFMFGLWEKVGNGFWEKELLVVFITYCANIVGIVGVLLSEANKKFSKYLIAVAFIVNSITTVIFIINGFNPIYYIIELFISILFWLTIYNIFLNNK